MDREALARLPSVDKLLSRPACVALLEKYGRSATTGAVRAALEVARHEILTRQSAVPGADDVLKQVETMLESADRETLTAVLNLTGTVLHTNLGRAGLAVEAIDAMVRVAGGAANLEFDLDSGERGDRDAHLEPLLTSICGGEAATVVNNNAAAVLLALNTLAAGKEVPVSRGELVEIGGSFRIPEIMERAGCRLVEIGTTNRTHKRDYARAINGNTALLMKVHASNYAIQGFTGAVAESDVAALAHENGLPLVTDLGSGTLLDLTAFGLPAEPTVTDMIESGADIITFSGDKLLGGPQAGIIVGKKQYIDAIKANPMKRALRVDKMTVAALAATLRLYRDPDTLARRLPTLRWLTRPKEDIAAQAAGLQPKFADKLKDIARVDIVDTKSQIGSGALPLDTLPSVALRITPIAGDGRDTRLRNMAARFRKLEVPVIGRIHDGALLFDLRTLDDPSTLVDQLSTFDVNAL